MLATAVPGMLLIAVGTAVVEDFPMLRKRLVEAYAAAAPHERHVRTSMASLRADGTWPDIDYANRLRGGWPTIEHLRRTQDLARAYAAKGHSLCGDAKLRDAVRRSLAHWTDGNYRNSNWWYGRIGIPREVAPTLLLMGDGLPEDLRHSAYDRLLRPSRMGMTGQNKVWVAGISFMKALLTDDRKLLHAARNALFSELRVTTREGIQPDWSFHQHGPQQQWGNYGSAFGRDMVRWAAILGPTPQAPAPQQLAVLRQYLLEGPSWVVWRGRMGISGCGRQVFPQCQATKGRTLLEQIAGLKALDPTAATACDVRLRSAHATRPNELVGHRHYWRSDIAVHRRPTWYASVKMCSRRTIGSESCNSENLRGLHLGDGAMYMLRSGLEYDDIIPVWDWQRLPGTTCRQADVSLVPNSRRCRGRGSFVGGVSDGRRGVAVMKYLRGSLRARKAWFFLGDRVICLGTGIASTDEGGVLTSINQCRLTGPVELGTAQRATGRLAGPTRQLTGPAWAHHDGIGYALPAGQTTGLAAREQTGDWESIRARGRKRPARMDVFSAWIDHGERPKAAGYAYATFPQAAPADMPALLASLDKQILSRTADLLAVADDAGRTVLAVFFAPGELTVGGKNRLAVDAPCVAILDRTTAPPRLHVADPTHKLEAVTVRVDGGKPRRIALPAGPQAGRSAMAL